MVIVRNILTNKLKYYTICYSHEMAELRLGKSLESVAFVLENQRKEEQV
jgi:hypothetical protein